MDLNKLKSHFRSEDLEWRVQRSGKSGSGIWAIVVAYVNNRAIMDRLDEVCGPDNWKNSFVPGPSGGLLCGISIRCSDGRTEPEWVTKWDGAENTDIEPVKGGLSGSMKRAAVQWGIGRYIYQFDITYANVHPNGAHYGMHVDRKTKQRTSFRWDPPPIPDWALPEDEIMLNSDKKELRTLCEQIGSYREFVSQAKDMPNAPQNGWTHEHFQIAIKEARRILSESNK